MRNMRATTIALIPSSVDPRQRHGGEQVPVEVVVDVEVAREARSRVLTLFPRAIYLGATKVLQAAETSGVLSQPGSLQRQCGPGRLRGRARPDSGEGAIYVGVAGFTPAAVVVLAPEQPGGAPVDHVLHPIPGIAQRGQRRDDTPGPIDVVDAPAAEPGPVRLLHAAQVGEPLGNEPISGRV